MKLNLGKLHKFHFYDHSATDNGNVFDEATRQPCEVTLCGYLLNVTALEYIVEVVRSSLKDNSNVWHILKSTMIGTPKQLEN